MLFIETKSSSRGVESSARLALLEKLQEKGLTPLIRSTRQSCYEQALLGPDRVAEMEREVAAWTEAELRRLRDLARRAADLVGGERGDAKLARAQDLVRKLLADGFRPIVFCRFIDTANYLADQCGRLLPGIDTRAPERQETRSGFFGSPNLAPMTSSVFFIASVTWAFSSGGYCLP